MFVIRKIVLLIIIGLNQNPFLGSLLLCRFHQIHNICIRCDVLNFHEILSNKALEIGVPLIKYHDIDDSVVIKYLCEVDVFV